MEEENFFKLVVPPNQTKERLDKFLTRFIGFYSRARLQKVIEEGLVLVNGTPAKSSHVVQPHEAIEVCIPKPKPIDILPEDIPLDILYEDEHLIVLNKRAGMVVHPAFANYTGTLVNALLHHCGDLSAIGGRQRPGIVHRLDKGTSGVMVVAKNDYAHQNLSLQFRNKTADRIYWAIVWHVPQKNIGRVETYLARSPKDRKRITVQPEGKLAATNYEVLEKFDLFSLVQLKLETGRTHQIRVHMAYIGHSVFGDKEYGGRAKQLTGLPNEQKEVATELLTQIDRQALHAKTLGFMHPIKKEYLSFESDLPEDMHLLLKNIRSLSF